MTTAPDPFARLHDALVDSARRTTPPRRSRRRMRPVLGVAAVGILVAGSAVAATTPWNPQLGGGPHREPATRTALPIPRALTDDLAILRRPQSGDDRTAAVQHALQLLDRDVAGGVFVDGIRRLRDRPDETVVLVPMRRYGPRDQPEAATRRNGLCVYVAENEPVAPGPVGGASCGTVGELERRGIGTITTRLVPDGVDRVRVKLRNGRTLTAEVTDNYYELPLTIPAVPFPADGKVTPAIRAAQRRQLKAIRQVLGRPKIWLDADGRAIRTTY